MEMSERLNVSRATVNSDLRVMRNQALTNMQTFVEKKLPYEYESMMTGISDYCLQIRDLLF